MFTIFRTAILIGTVVAAVAVAARAEQDCDPTVVAAPPKGSSDDGFAANQGQIAVAESGLLVSDFREGSGPGRVYWFTPVASGWMLEQALEAPGGGLNDNFGLCIASEGDVLIAGARHWPGGSVPLSAAPGAAFVFRLGPGGWELESQLAPTVVREEFGFRVAVTRGWIFVSAPASNDAGEFRGAVYVFRESPDGWVFTQKILNPAGPGVPGQWFGQNGLASDGEWLAVSCYSCCPDCQGGPLPRGIVFLYRLEDDQWILRQQVAPDVQGTAFAQSIDLRGSLLAVGAPTFPFASDVLGAVFAYRRVNDVWMLDGILSAVERSGEGGGAGDHGFSVVIEGDEIYAGARNLQGLQAGGIVRHRRVPEGWLRDYVLLEPQGQASGAFGQSLAARFGLVVAGQARPEGLTPAVMVVDRTDTDADGVPDCADNCPLTPNANQADCDGNGIGDACEEGVGAIDADANGIPDVCEYLLVPEVYPTIAAAVAAADGSRAISIAAGVYSERIAIESMGLTLFGRGGAVVLDGGGEPGPLLTVGPKAGGVTRIEGLEFRGAVGGGVDAIGGPDVGAGLFAVDASLELVACRFEGSVAGSGGGLFVRGGSVLIDGCEFVGNAAAGDGGAFFVIDATLNVVGSSIRGNQASGSGGGLRFASSDGTTIARVLSSEFLGNVAKSGGAIHAEPAFPAILEVGATAVCGNSAPQIVATGPVQLSPNPLCPCPGDLNGDRVVNAADLSVLLGFWGATPPAFPAADITGDGFVDAADLAVLLGAWGACL